MQSRPFIVLFMFLLLSSVGGGSVNAQDKGFHFGPLIGLHHGEEVSLEAGLGYGEEWIVGHNLELGRGVGLSIERVMAKDPVVGARLSAWYHIFLALGLSAGYYTDFDQGAVVLQPELGFGLSQGRISWRTTIPFSKMPQGMSSSDVTVSFMFGL
ncbi:MAG: hypothetical protein KDD67_08140 [Ignavibacteriae bacterium]|nr:hypothetical protein [Ignavibacteriota bacterium]